MSKIRNDTQKNDVEQTLKIVKENKGLNCTMPPLSIKCRESPKGGGKKKKVKPRGNQIKKTRRRGSRT